MQEHTYLLDHRQEFRQCKSWSLTAQENGMAQKPAQADAWSVVGVIIGYL